MTEFHGKYLALCGGVGGAKLALGLTRVLDPEQLAIVVNTGDDFEHLGLHISPDIDTVCYTLAGLSNTELGWGLQGESWEAMSRLEKLGGETWFRLGDKDLATHLYRTAALARGETLEKITADIALSIGIEHLVLPMSNQAVRTHVVTNSGTLPFQHYFVREQCKPRVNSIYFEGADRASLTPAITEWINDDELQGIIVCPSNPYLSIDPILSTGKLRDCLQQSRKPVLVVSPIIGGSAVKGPTAKIMQEMNIPQNNIAIAGHYKNIASHLVIDQCDAGDSARVESRHKMTVSTTTTLMKTEEDKVQLARFVLQSLQETGQQ